MISSNHEQFDPDIAFVSVIIPTKNEEKYISKCIESLENSDYPKERMELIVIDGGSIDKTVDLVESLQRKYKNVLLIRYGGANTSVGRNIGVKKAVGDVIFNFSGHALVERDSISILSAKLCNSTSEVAGVGCKDRIPVDQFSLIALGTDAITSTILGGTLMHQHAILEEEGFFDSISFTAYRKIIFKEIGFFNPAFPSGDDAEFNLRIKNAGYKLLYTPATCVYRYRRDKLKAFFWQMFNYGRSRMQISRAHNKAIRLAYAVPMIFVAYLFTLVGLLFVSNVSLLIGWSTGFFVYLFLLIVLSIKISFSRRKPVLFFLCLLLYIIEHFAYGLGLIWGLISVKRVVATVVSNDSFLEIEQS